MWCSPLGSYLSGDVFVYCDRPNTLRCISLKLHIRLWRGRPVEDSWRPHKSLVYHNINHNNNWWQTMESHILRANHWLNPSTKWLPAILVLRLKFSNNCSNTCVPKMWYNRPLSILFQLKVRALEPLWQPFLLGIRRSKQLADNRFSFLVIQWTNK